MTLRYDLSRPQQYLLQIFMNRGVIDQYDFKNVFTDVEEINDSKARFDSEKN